jgi:hypothetical protein
MELNFLFGNPVRRKKGGKSMARKKRSAIKENPKRKKRRAKRNPTVGGAELKQTEGGKYAIIDARGPAAKAVKPAKVYLTPTEQLELKRKLKTKIKGLGKAKTSFSLTEQLLAQEAGIDLSAVGEYQAKASELIKLRSKLSKLKEGADSATKKNLNAQIVKINNKLAAYKGLGIETSEVDRARKKQKYSDVLKNLSKFSSANMASDGWEPGELSSSALDIASADVDDLADILAKQLKTESGKPSRSEVMKALLGKADAQELADLLKSNPRRKGRKSAMAKKRKSKAKHTKRKGKKSYRRKGRRSKAAKIAAAMAAAGIGHKKRRKKRRGHKKAHRSHRRRNPIDAGMLKELAMIGAAGALSALAVGAVSKMAKPILDKLPSAITGLKVGNAPVGQLVISALVPAGLYMAMKRSNVGFLSKAADVLAVVTAANIGSRLASGFLPAGMIAGVEPTLLGVEPSLMGEADFGEADFGAVEQFSGYGAEPVLMGEADFGDADFGEADFGSIQQYSGYGAVEQFSGYGAVQQYAGDEDYAGDEYEGEDFDGEDFDGESAHGLG